MNKNKMRLGSHNRTQRGITLIALIITIIVMLILVAVTINMAINGGLFEKAGKAVSDTQNAINTEQELADGRIQIGGKWYASIDDYIAGKYEGYVPTYEEAIKEANGILKENATYTIEEDGTAVVPKGFKVIEGLNGEKSIKEGLVIQDSSGNEFVWIPVTYTKTNTDTDNNGYDDGFDAVFYRSAWEDNSRTTGLNPSFTEPYESGYDEEITEYNQMVKSVYDNGGFYIGRYEAGSTTARTDTANGTTEMVVRRDAYPYNYVGWGLTINDYTSDVTYNSKNQGKGALYLSKHMYDGKDIGAISTLCYGIQWDAMLDFVKDSTYNVTNSTNWGNYYNTSWTITRTTAKYIEDYGETWNLIDDEEGDSKSKDSSTKILLTTGASDDFAAKNIFDIAGNVREWTNEALNSYYRTLRGGSYRKKDDAYLREGLDDSYTYKCSVNNGFRPTLYIK